MGNRNGGITMGGQLRAMPAYVNKIAGFTKSKTSNGYVFDLAAAKRYYSNIDVEIYIGNTYIDDAVTLQFALQQNVGTILGYNSYVTDAFVLGARTVQGMFEVNFTSPNYLNKVLDAVKKVNNQSFELTSYKVERDNRDAKAIIDPTGTSTVTDNDKHAPVWTQGFNLDIMMGQKTKGIEPAHFIITDCQISSLQVGMSPEGAALTERYAFVGKDIKTIG